MSLAISKVPTPVNEPVKSHLPGSPERASLQARLAELAATRTEMPLVIDGKDVRTGKLGQAVMLRTATRTCSAISTRAARPRRARRSTPRLRAQPTGGAAGSARVKMFLKAADLLAGPYRDVLNAATMLGQSKTCHQAEIDSAWRADHRFLPLQRRVLRTGAARTAAERPRHVEPAGTPAAGRLRVAVPPFNFTSIAGNPPTAPALCGNTVVWKPASTAVYSAFPHAVVPRSRIARRRDQPGQRQRRRRRRPGAADPHLAGIHFTGSTRVFHQMWRTVGNNIDKYQRLSDAWSARPAARIS